MASPHHVIHAVCFAIIAFLFKKNGELRAALGDLKTEQGQLRATHPPAPSPGLGGTPGRTPGGVCYCPCPCQSPLPLLQSQTEIRAGAVFTDSTAQYRSAGGRDMFSDVPDPDAVPVDDFGRTLEQAADLKFAASKIQGSQSVPVSVQKSQFLAVQHGAEDTPARFTSGVSVRSSAPESRERGDGWTERGHDTQDVSLQATRESLESLRPSPSTLFPAVASSHTPQAAISGQVRAGSHDNDFYLGSRSEDDEDTEEMSVTVTSVDSGLTLTPQAVHVEEQRGRQATPRDVDGESEAVEMEEQPAGTVELDWLAESEVEKLSVTGTERWSRALHLHDKVYQFSNLCFNAMTEEFVVLVGPTNISEESRDHLGKLSTVAGYTSRRFPLRYIPSTQVTRFSVALLETVVIFERFKPDNIMHVFHDDVLPLFNTLLKLGLRPDAGSERFPAAVFLADDHGEGEFFSLYSAFSTVTFTFRSLQASVARAAPKSDALVCFSQAMVGLTQATTWYQYGYFKPQGPSINHGPDSDLLHSASSFLLNNFATPCPFCRTGSDYLVLISRKETRRILNEMDLVLAISRELRVKVMTVSLETHNLQDIIAIVHGSLGMIGMHGSLLALAVFLRQGSVLVELFPYGVSPDSYRPYRTLCQIPYMDVHYRAWVNTDRAATTPHPDWPPELGGIHHLPVEKQQEIWAQTTVPPHLCCEDPSWLFHVFQDTQVNIPQVTSLVSQALSAARSWRQSIPDNLTRSASLDAANVKPPGPVLELHSMRGYSPSLSLFWDPPWNAGLYAHRNLTYRVIVYKDHYLKPTHIVDVGNALKYSLSLAADVKVIQQIVVYSVVDDAVLGPFAGILRDVDIYLGDGEEWD